ncbi:MAG: hypothetical protein ABW318_14420 [Vicinamibacterales bacterium]
MFEFPSSPTLGQSANGYVYDGTGWLGGGLSMAGPITEEFFDMSGKTQQDVTVPAWAKGVEIVASIIPPAAANNALAVRVSADGMTFPAGANDYAVAAPYHVSAPTASFATQAAANRDSLTLGIGGTTTALPHLVDAFLTLERKLTSEGFTARAYSRAQDATAGSSTAWHYSYVQGATLGSALRVAALRFFLWSAGGTMGNGSFLKVKWHGPATDLPRTNAIPEAPSTGGEYVRVNGVWRLRSQSLTLDGGNIATGVGAFAPVGAKMVRFTGRALWGPATSAGITMRVSYDGATWETTAGNYATSGVYFGNTATTVQNLPGTNAAFFYLTTAGGVANYGHAFEGLLSLTRLNTSAIFQGRVSGTSFTGSAHYHNLYSMYSGAAPWGLTLKGVNFGMHNLTGNFQEGTVDLEWVY